MNVDGEERYKSELICAICGAAHSTVSCEYANFTNHIFNQTSPTRARLSLPKDFSLYTLADGRYKVVTNKFIQRGTRFGPLEAAKSFTLNPTIHFPLKIFPFGDDNFLEYYLDTEDQDTSTWMIFVEPAENYEEQNLICYQEDQYIFFLSIKNINASETLKVWYGPHYAKKMCKPLLEEKSVQTISSDTPELDQLVRLQQNIPDVDSWTCKFCNAIITEITKFANHLIVEHYKTQIKKKCRGCKATFRSRKCLCQLLVKSTYSNKKKLTTYETAETSSDVCKEASIGGPLLNSTVSPENLENSDLIIQTPSSEDTQMMVVENFNTENLLVTENFRTMDYFNFDIEEVKEEIVCDVCFKNFSTLPNLIQHLKGHRGDYHCSGCNKVFSRKENLTHHSCNVNLIFHCESCSRSFSQKKYYQRHIDTVHNYKFKCHNCHKNYANKFELDLHNCKLRLNQCQMYSCGICKKVFSQQRYLRKHVSRKHENNRIFICEVCSKQYTTKVSYELHAQTHKKPQFKCEICQKECHRKDIFKEHKVNVHINQVFKCDLCSKNFKCKKYLLHHKKTHKKIKHNCNNCRSSFQTKSNLTRHSKIHQKNGSVPDGKLLHQCKYCGKRMKLSSSLLRHIRNKHSLVNSVSQEMVEKGASGKDALQFLGGGLDLTTDTQDNIDLITDEDMDELGRKHIQVIDNILLRKSEEMGLGLNNYILNSNDTTSNPLTKPNKMGKCSTSEIEEKEVLLSMPDLMEIENDIILGNSTSTHYGIQPTSARKT
ncbi:zinc finger and BTB domain-containing protein 41-like isoform X1 [Coccinella septempunctata]|uniref:zinc finger and BTB domain-containing protein 41-like isoform X1 n=1 Tax=Coccinella septempunctata TaxID=41139 RepID=UPI001D08F610|nr:zinc finger and BTB domain-containing protein 41-like isoform X1 [Coccinella septempunctata]